MMQNTDLLGIDDLTSEEMVALIDTAAQLRRARKDGPRNDLTHKTVALIFEKPSTRTRVSFQVAVTELGGDPLVLSATDLQLGRGETIADTGRVLSRYVHAIVIRTFGQERLAELADAASVPVINALTDEEHPCQALADLLTLQDEFGALRGRRLTYVGDGNNVAHSLLLAGAKVGMHVDVAHPAGYAPDANVVKRAHAIAADTGAVITVTTDVDAVVDGTDALYADVWTSMGQEAEAQTRLNVFTPYQITQQMLDRASDTAIFLHCLPAHRGEEVTAEVIDGPRSRVFDQAENRMHAQKAVLRALLGEGA
ncbi:MAG: ornithine carbamoyltransferase [Nitriliruptoraceae bacterium]